MVESRARELNDLPQEKDFLLIVKSDSDVFVFF